MNARSLAPIAAALAIAACGAALGHDRPNPSPGPAVRHVEHVRTGGVWLCEGTLIVRYDLERLTRFEWVPVLDDGRVAVQTAPTTGRWVTLPAISGGEGIRRVPDTTVPALQAVRVVRHGVASTARLATEGCSGL